MPTSLPEESAKTRDPQNFIRSLSRGLSVIEALGSKVEGATLSELAVQCKLDRATSRRILLTLAELGYVRASGNRYLIAPRALSLGYAYLSSMPFWEIATPIMEQLVLQVHESCSAATLDGTHVVYVARVRSNERFVDVGRTVGSRIPAYCTSLGRVLLAVLPPEQQKRLLKESSLQKHTEHTVTDVAELRKILDQVRDAGHAVVDQEMEIGLRSLAVPLHDRNGTAMAALNVSVQASRVSVDELLNNYLAPLRATAKQLDDAARSRQPVK